MTAVWVSGSFDDLRSRHVRFLEEASRLGDLHVLLWSDAAVRSFAGRDPRFPEAERAYLVGAIRHVKALRPSGRRVDPDALPDEVAARADLWVVPADEDAPARRTFCARRGIACRVLPDEGLAGFPPPPPPVDPGPGRKKVIVTGSYDWFHSGHVRFFEEVSALGALYVVVGHDANVRLLKGGGHPMFPQAERVYMVASVRYVHAAMLSTGRGWLDAEPEIRRIRPDIYAVNEDGDKPVKRAFCEANGIEYIVRKRTPKAGLPRRESTTMRGF